MVEKADAIWRLCSNYRRLNLEGEIILPPPHIEDLSAQLAGKVVLSKLDLGKGYSTAAVALAVDVQSGAGSGCGLCGETRGQKIPPPPHTHT